MRQFARNAAVAIAVCATGGFILDRLGVNGGMWYFMLSLIIVGVVAVYPAAKTTR